MAKRNRRPQHMSGTTTHGLHNLPGTPLPPSGAEMAADDPEMANAAVTETTIGEGSPAGETYPATETSTMTEEELKEKQAAEVKERETRAKRATGPRKLNPNERKVVAHWMEHYLGENDPVTKFVPFTELEKDLKPFFQPSMKDNVVQRGVFNAVYDDDTRQLTGVHLTESGAELYTRSLRKSQVNNGEPTGRVTRGVKTTAAKVTRATRTTKYPDNIRLRKMHNVNPRRAESHGYYSYDLYENGMTYSQYLKKEYDKTLMTAVGTPFDGPKRVHWDWDVMHGNIALYYADVPEFKEDGSDNPDFWYINVTGRAEPEATEIVEDVVEEAATEAVAE